MNRYTASIMLVAEGWAYESDDLKEIITDWLSEIGDLKIKDLEIYIEDSPGNA